MLQRLDVDRHALVALRVLLREPAQEVIGLVLERVTPVAAVDVTPYREQIAAVADFYMHGVGFGDPTWIEHRLREAGERWGSRYAEEVDAWESEGQRLVPALLPAALAEHTFHPPRPSDRA